MLALLFSIGLAQAAAPTGPELSLEGGHAAWPALAADADLSELAPFFEQAAADFAVPQALLLALSWEASRWDARAVSQWGGYGLFDLREADGGFGPRLEDAAILLGESPDDIIAEPELQIRAAAAMLARSAAIGNGGELPDVADLDAWVSAVASFSGRHEPSLQDMYVRFVFEVVHDGAERDGLVLPPTDVEVTDWLDLPPPPTSSCDYSGCYQFSSASSTNYTNQSRTASDITHVIIHTVQGSYSGCISWFQNSSSDVSAHYVVRSSDGQVTQMVREEDKAWHAGSANGYSVGIEHEGYVDAPSTWYTDAMYAGSAALTADIIARQGIPASRSYIIGHNEAPGATHTDPGSGWDWDTYMSLISGGEVTGDLMGVVAVDDIYSGDYLPGASVWIAETGETTTVGSDGYYRFYDLPLDSYTVWASRSGYVDGSCAKTLESGTNWCSIALEVDSGGGDGGTTTDGGSTDGGSSDGGTFDGGAEGDGGAGDGGGPGQEPPSTLPPGSPPGVAVPMNDLRGGCSTAPARPLWALSLLGLLVIPRRRR